MLAGTVLLSGCSGGGGSEPEEQPPGETAQDTTDTADTTTTGGEASTAVSSSELPADDADCPNGGILVESGIDENGNGVLDEDEVDNSEKVCNGADGSSSQVAVRTSVLGAGDEDCPTGGTLVEAGLDDNQDGVLDDDEVDSSEKVCNGADGTSSLVAMRTSEVETGDTDCPAGGTLIEAGIDDDKDGALSDDEVELTSKVCNGPGGSPGDSFLLSTETLETGDPNCPYGGVEVSLGLDTSGEGTLDPEEVEDVQYLCNDGPSAVQVSNVLENGVLHSGFLIGTVASWADASSVEVALDGGAYAAATGVEEWSYALPTGANTWRDDSEHTVSVRALDEEAGTLDTVEVTFRKGVNRDVNGDGYEDLAVGALRTSTNGRVYIFHSYGDVGIRASYAAQDADTTITGAASTDYFGASVALGDVNGDGYADLAVGSYSNPSSNGTAFVFLSDGADGITASAAGSDADTTITGEATTYFGERVALGDITGDGYADLVVSGVLYNNNNTGRVYAFYSEGAGGIDETGAGSADVILTGESTSNYFGTSIALGDVDGNGYADLAVGAYGYSSNDGRAYIFLSDGSSGLPSVTSDNADTVIDAEASGDQFAARLALGDITGDGYADLVVGAQDYGSAVGRVYTFHSTGSGGITATDAGADASAKIDGDNNGDAFGDRVAIGDVNGDGFADVAVMALEFLSNTGRAYVFHSSGAGGLTADSAFADSAAYFTGSATGDFFGHSVGFQDLNGDGTADLTIGSYANTGGKGRLYLFNGTEGKGLSTTPALTEAAATILGESGGDWFSYSVP